MTMTPEQVREKAREFLSGFTRIEVGTTVWWKRDTSPFYDLLQDDLLTAFGELLLGAVPPAASGGQPDEHQQVLDDLHDAIRVLHFINEETVLAGYPPGDRNQTLANVREMRKAASGSGSPATAERRKASEEFWNAPRCAACNRPEDSYRHNTDSSPFAHKFVPTPEPQGGGKEAQIESDQHSSDRIRATGASGQPSGSLASQSPRCPICGKSTLQLFLGAEVLTVRCKYGKHSFEVTEANDLRQFFPPSPPADKKELAQRIAEAVNKWYESPDDKCELGEIIEQELSR